MIRIKNVHRFFSLQLAVFYFAICCLLLFSQNIATTQTESNYRSFVLSKTIGYMFYFSLYTEWSEDSIQNNEIVISVFSSENEAQAIFNVLNGKTIDDKKIVINHVLTIDDFSKSNLVYIAQDWEVNKEEILKKANEWKAITFGFDQDFIKKGGMVQFLLKPETVEFSINLDLIRKSRIAINPRVLRLAK